MAGYGEVPVFQGLSTESPEMVEASLKELTGITLTPDILANEGLFSSVRFGLEQAFYDISHKDNPRGEIIINGLVWMGNYDIMKCRVIDKIRSGFRCIKVKIGAINFEEELSLLRLIRKLGGPNITIRVDANGGFTPEECPAALERLAEFDIHSIEQPIKNGQWEEMREICRYSPVPVALDEELIGLLPGPRRSELLEMIAPQYIILKPALCFGFFGASDWISRAEEHGVGWWITSALESSVGLYGIACYTLGMHARGPQGLGTGNLFTNNLPSRLSLSGDTLSFNESEHNYYTVLSSLPWHG